MAKAKKEKVPARHVVVISRNWDNPEINISITDMMIAVAMKMPAFKKALALELDVPKDAMANINAAIDRVLSKMKSETSRVM